MQRLSQATNLNTTLQDRLSEVSFMLKKETLSDADIFGASGNKGTMSSGSEPVLGKESTAQQYKEGVGSLMDSIDVDKASYSNIRRFPFSIYTKFYL